jgi:hypothetical protein
MEQRAFNLAAKNIYPDDVRITPAGYIDKTLVGWAGLIIEGQFEEKEDEIEARLTVEHRHFDWLENFSLVQNTFTLSSRGEGRFRTVWPMTKRYGLEEVKRYASPGNMVVVYGTPKEIEDGIIGLDAACVRFIPAGRVRFGEYPYGRNAGWQY